MWNLVLLIEHLRRNHRLDDFGDDGIGQVAQRNFFVVLRRDDDGVNAGRAAVNVFDGNLGFAVGAEKIEFAGLAHVGEALGELVRELDRHGHQLGSLVAGEAEHHALIAGAAGVYTHGDVRGLLLDGADDAASLGVEAVLGARIADVADYFASEIGEINVGRGGNFAGDDNEARGDERLAADAAHRIVLQDGVEDGVGNLVGNLVGMALGDRLRGKQELLIGMRQNSTLQGSGKHLRGRIELTNETHELRR